MCNKRDLVFKCLVPNKERVGLLWMVLTSFMVIWRIQCVVDLRDTMEIVEKLPNERWTKRVDRDSKSDLYLTWVKWIYESFGKDKNYEGGNIGCLDLRHYSSLLWMTLHTSKKGFHFYFSNCKARSKEIIISVSLNYENDDG